MLMPRIRTIKPEFFKHRRLYLAERETRMPLRVAFAGLWCVGDREGRFRWEPEELKLDCLPFDKVDFARVLDALATREFIGKYEVAGRHYGFIPGFRRHQVVNNRESASAIPAPPKEVMDLLTRGARVADALATRHDPDQGEGKGKEGKGSTTAAGAAPDGFEILWKAYPRRAGDNPKRKAERAYRARIAEGHAAQELLDGVGRYAKFCHATGKLDTEFVKQASTFLGPDKPFLQPWTAPIEPGAPRSQAPKVCGYCPKPSSGSVNGIPHCEEHFYDAMDHKPRPKANA